MSESTAQLLRNIIAFKALPEASLNEIARYSEQRLYEPEQTVIAYGEQSTTVFFLLSGAVRATMFTQQGREISYQDLGVGEMFGELAAIDHLPRSTSVIARKQSRLLLVPGDFFLKLIATHPEIGQATLCKLAGVVRFLCDRVYNFGALDVRSRVRAELCRLAELSTESGKDIVGAIEIRNMPKHQELANRLATHREAVSRELSALEKSGLIKKGRGSLQVLDLDALRSSYEG